MEEETTVDAKEKKNEWVGRSLQWGVNELGTYLGRRKKNIFYLKLNSYYSLMDNKYIKYIIYIKRTRLRINTFKCFRIYLVEPFPRTHVASRVPLKTPVTAATVARYFFQIKNN